MVSVRQGINGLRVGGFPSTMVEGALIKDSHTHGGKVGGARLTTCCSGRG
jgi:hypothetical protein